MAIFHLSVKTVSRSTGRSAVAAAAYRAGMELIDQSTGIVHDYTRKRGVLSTDLILPEGAPDYDRSSLWNAAEVAEKRSNSTVAREFEIALPDGLTAGKRRELTLAFARELVAKHRCAADVAIHAPDTHDGTDDRNYHAHILLTTRRIDANGFGAKTRELDDRKSGIKHVKEWRERWADMQNEALEQAQRTERVDHRSHRARGLDLKPQRKMGAAANALERKGVRTEQGDYNRFVKEYNATIVELAELRAERDRQLAFKAKFAAAAAVPQLDFGPEPEVDLFEVQAAAELAQANAEAAKKAAHEALVAKYQAEQAAATAAFQAKAKAAEAQAEQERERTRALFAAKALAAQEAKALAAAVVSREAVALGGFVLEAMTDHLIDHPKDRAGLLEMYVNAPVDLTSKDSYTGQQRLKVTKWKAEQTALNRRAEPIRAEFEALQAELKAELSRPVFARIFSSKAKEIEAKIDRNRGLWTKLKEAYEKLASSIAYIVERLSDYEKAETQNVLQQRKRDFEAAERAVPQRIEQRRTETQEAPERARIESERRTNALSSLVREHGPEATFAALALAAIKEANGGEVDWPTVEDKALREMTKNGWQPERSLKVILEHSPDRTPLSPADLTLALQDAQRLEALKPKPDTAKADKPEPPQLRGPR